MEKGDIEFRIKCSLFVAKPILVSLADLLANVLVNCDDIGALCKELMSDRTFHEAKCCDECQHVCSSCNGGECTQCRSIGSCKKQELNRAISEFLKLYQIENTNSFSSKCESLVNGEFVFPEFPYCRTWKRIWERFHDAVVVCSSFLLKESIINEDGFQDNLMYSRMVLRLSKTKLESVFDEVPQKIAIMAKDLEDVRFQPHQCEDTPSNAEEIILVHNAANSNEDIPSNAGEAVLVHNAANSNDDSEYKLSREDIVKDWTHGDILKLAINKQEARLVALFDNESYLFDQVVNELPVNELPFIAVTTNNKSLMKICIDNRFDSLQRTSARRTRRPYKDGNYTLYEIAVKEGYLDVLKMLVAYNSKGLTLQTKAGSTLLPEAICSGRIEVVKYLLQQKEVDVNMKDTNGQTPLHHACLNKQLEMVELLLKEKGIDVNAENKERLNPLIIAVDSSNLHMANLLLQQKGVNPNPVDRFGIPLLYSAFNRDMNIFNLLLQQEGVHINAIYGKGRTLLHSACLNEQFEMVEFLLKEGVEINVRDKSGFTALQYCCHAEDRFDRFDRPTYYYNYKIISLLLKQKGINVDAFLKSEDTILQKMIAKHRKR